MKKSELLQAVNMVKRIYSETTYLADLLDNCTDFDLLETGVNDVDNFEGWFITVMTALDEMEDIAEVFEHEKINIVD